MAEEGTADYYRKKAAEVRAHAATVEDGEMQNQLLTVADTYDRLAAYAERKGR
jgi:hypothetical protein